MAVRNRSGRLCGDTGVCSAHVVEQGGVADVSYRRSRSLSCCDHAWLRSALPALHRAASQGRVDEWLVGHLNEYDGKQFQDVARGALDLGELDSEEEQEAQKKAEEENAPLVERTKAVLEQEVEDVRVTTRLTESPACLVVGEHDMGAQMRRIMEAAGQTLPDSKPIFELNPDHPLVQKLDGEADEDRFAELARVLFEQAQLASGGQLEDPAAYVHRLNKLLLELSA